MKTMAYQRKSTNNIVLEFNSENQPEITNSYSFSNYAKAGLAIAGTIGTVALAHTTGFLPSFGMKQDATIDKTFDNSQQLINPQEAIISAESGLLLTQPKHTKRAFGTEFQINTYTENNQHFPAVAGLTTGDFVVVWQSEMQDGVRDNIYGQRFSSAGVAQGNEFRINAFVGNNQRSPAVAELNTGGFLAVWEGSGGPGPVAWGIFGRGFSNTGVAQGSEFHAQTGSNQDYPSVAALATGDFMLVWQCNSQYDSDDSAIHGQRFSSAGGYQGNEFKINSYTTSFQRYPSVVALTSGDFVVLWESDGQDGSQYGIYGQRYSITGIKQGSEFQVNTYTVGNQLSPSVAALATGDFVVVWQSDGQDGSQYGIYGQRYFSAGIKQGGEFQVNTYTVGNQLSPSVAALATSDFVVVWESMGQDGGNAGVYGRIYPCIRE